MSWSLSLIRPDGTDIPVIESHTYNLTPMWDLAGMCSVTRELDNKPAHQIGILAADALRKAVRYPQAFKALNPSNDWGDYDAFINALMGLAIACSENRDAKTSWRG